MDSSRPKSSESAQEEGPTTHDIFLWMTETPMSVQLWKDLRRSDLTLDVHRALDALLDEAAPPAAGSASPDAGGEDAPPELLGESTEARRTALRSYLEALKEVLDQATRPSPAPLSLTAAKTFSERLSFDAFRDTGSGMAFQAWFRLRG